MLIWFPTLVGHYKMTFNNISGGFMCKDYAWTDSIEKWRPLSHISTVISYTCKKKNKNKKTPNKKTEQNISLSTVKSFCSRWSFSDALCTFGRISCLPENPWCWANTCSAKLIITALSLAVWMNACTIYTSPAGLTVATQGCSVMNKDMQEAD